MPKPYVIKDKILRMIQNILDDIKLNPENRNEAYRKFDDIISKNDITDEQLKQIIEKMISEFKDFSYDEMFNELKKMKGGF